MNWLPRLNPRLGLRIILVVQLTMAALLIANDVFVNLPSINRQPLELPSGPVSPGDQRREYRTDRPDSDMLTLDAPPDLPLPTKFSDRLQFIELKASEIGSVLLLSGGIEVGDAERFATFLKEMAKRPDMIALHSPGGIVKEAQKIGRTIRNEELPTGVFAGAFCMSSCPYVLAGGVERVVSLRSIVGLHQHYYEQPKLIPAVFAVEDIQIGQGETMEFLIDMNIEPSLMIYSLKTPPEQIYALIEAELKETKIATQIID